MPTTQTPTSSPWRIEDGDFIYQLNTAGINVFSCQVQGGYAEDGHRTTKEERAKIARLIAAAPDLLAALKNLVLSTDGIVSGPESDLCACCGKDYIDEQIRRAEAGEDCIYECTDQDCPRVQAFAAIAKATGSEVPA